MTLWHHCMNNPKRSMHCCRYRPAPCVRDLTVYWCPCLCPLGTGRMSSPWKTCSCLGLPLPRAHLYGQQRPWPSGPYRCDPAPAGRTCCLPMVSRADSQMARAASRACSVRFSVAFSAGLFLRRSASCLPPATLCITCKALAFRCHPEASADCPHRPRLAWRAPPPCSAGTAVASVAQSLVIPRQDSHMHAGWLPRMCWHMATHSLMPVQNHHDQDHEMDCHYSLPSGTWPADIKADRTRLRHLST